MEFGLMTFYLILLLLVCSEAKHKSYGSQSAHEGQFPFVALLSYNGQKFCGASIIHERWAITAAHCLQNKTAKSLLTVGTVKDLGSGTNYEIDKFYAHPSFFYIPEDENDGIDYVVNDIGLTHLASNISFNDKVQPITLATYEDDHYKNSMATLPSWGANRWYGNMRNHLHFIKVRILSLSECRKTYPYANRHICTSTREQKGACHGDSGSPLVFDGIQIGILSAGGGLCNSIRPDLSTKVASFTLWIESILNKHGDALPDPQLNAAD